MDGFLLLFLLAGSRGWAAMCGITGFVDFKPAAKAALLARAIAMADTLRHRGPDAGASWADPDAGFATGHRRLSIVDLSEAGNQPMVSQSARFVISYNGEVYNSAEIRPELQAKGYVFRGHSDTEVILEACAESGVHATVRRLIGMFAFALWDRQAHRLWLVRDRLGIKPLYWGHFGKLLLFGSELKALRAHPGWSAEINRDAIAAFVRFGYIPTPHSIYRNVYKLPPGAILEVDAHSEPRIERFWTLDGVIEGARRNPFNGSDADAEEALATLLGDAVQRRMIADVPLGAFLSGGIDSSTVVSLMQLKSTRPVRTFSIGFQQEEYNEAHHAKAVANHLGTDHTELYVTHDQARDVIPRLSEIYDEPFADSSQIPTYLISALTRRHVTVALTGDGGDELFRGYSWYFHAQSRRYLSNLPPSVRPYLSTLPHPVFLAASRVIRAVPPRFWNHAQRIVPARMRWPNIGDKLHNLAGVITQHEDENYLQLRSRFHQPNDIVNGASEPTTILASPAAKQFMPNYVERMQYLDMLTFLPDDILTKVDRASMAMSLEARVPIIDHRVVELAWRFPARMRFSDGKSKWILRRVLRRFVPDALVDRPKKGFEVPIDHWMRGPLREWAEDLLSISALTRDDLFNPEPIRARWIAHLQGRGNWRHLLWSIIMVQAWRARYASAPTHLGAAAETVFT
jgi:asparagine synthase (glutamine-hydrolysing)